MAMVLLDDYSFAWSDRMALWLIMEPLARVLAVPDCGRSMSYWSERDGGACSATTGAAVVFLCHPVGLAVGKLPSPPYPHRAARWSGPPGPPSPHRRAMTDGSPDQPDQL